MLTLSWQIVTHFALDEEQSYIPDDFSGNLEHVQAERRRKE